MIERLKAEANRAVSVMTASRAVSDETTEHANNAEQTLSRISELIQSLSDMNRQIAAAAEEQSATTSSVNESITEVQRIAQSTSERMVATLGTANELSAIGATLKSQVSQFRVWDTGPCRVPCLFALQDGTQFAIKGLPEASMALMRLPSTSSLASSIHWPRQSMSSMQGSVELPPKGNKIAQLLVGERYRHQTGLTRSLVRFQFCQRCSGIQLSVPFGQVFTGFADIELA